MSDRNHSVKISTRSMSAVANVGSTWPECWDSLLAGREHFSPIQQFFPNIPFGSPVAGIEKWSQGAPPIEERARCLAERVAAEIKGFVDDQFDRNPDIRMGLIVATSHAESGPVSSLAKSALSSATSNVQASTYRSVLVEELLPAVCKGLGRALPGSTIAAACASSIVAVAHARDQISMGIIDACVVVAVDALSCIAYTGFKQIGAMSVERCRPFDKSRDGTIVGEAGVAFLLSRAEPGEDHICILGTGQNCDARHAVEPATDGIVMAIRAALEQAKVRTSELLGVYWHGSGTIQNDAAEAEAAAVLFGRRSPPCTATKGTFGHSMGASAGLSTLAACETVRTGRLPPINGLRETTFPWLDLVKGKPRVVQRGPLLVVALGFGGINAALVVAPQ
jgi:3-oxoacyl-[acyl-carrier-protein] synthase II